MMLILEKKEKKESNLKLNESMQMYGTAQNQGR